MAALFPGTIGRFTTGSFWLLNHFNGCPRWKSTVSQPASSQEVAQRKSDHDRQPKEAGCYYDQHQWPAIAEMHKEKSYKQRLSHGDYQGYDSIQAAEIDG
jgi:hypothetical protein